MYAQHSRASTLKFGTQLQRVKKWDEIIISHLKSTSDSLAAASGQLLRLLNLIFYVLREFGAKFDSFVIAVTASTHDEVHSLLLFQELHILLANGQPYCTLFVSILGRGRMMLVVGPMDLAMRVACGANNSVVGCPIVMAVGGVTFGSQGTNYGRGHGHET